MAEYQRGQAERRSSGVCVSIWLWFFRVDKTSKMP
jgi:hypothetical protein